MNKNQRNLTLAALAALICLLLFDPFKSGSLYRINDEPRFTTPKVVREVGHATLTYGGELNDSGVALVVLAVGYVGLFFVLADKRNGISGDKPRKPTSTANSP
jgi:hypothetical protein